MRHSETLGALAAALAKAQGEMTGAIKDATNPFFKSTYADLESVWEACRIPLSQNGLAVTQLMDHDVSGPILITTLMHASGEWVSSAYPIRPMKDDPQALGSCTTYARRYSLAAIVGIVQTDDDAEGAMARDTPPPAPSAPSPIMKRKPNEEPTAYTITWGKKYKGKQLKEIPNDELLNYAKFIEESAAKEGKPLSGPMQEFIAQVALHISKTQVV